MFEVPAVHSVEPVGLVGLGSDEDGEPLRKIGLDDDLDDDDLRAEVLAFDLAVLVGTL